MDVIERYLEAVAAQLSVEEREDIVAELRDLILSRIEGAYIPRQPAWWCRRLAAVVIAVFLLPTARSWSQDLAAPLPLDPALRTGTLPNGLT